MHVIVLGAGLVGAAMARDLSKDPSLTVTSIDRDRAALAQFGASDRISTVLADLSNPEKIDPLISTADLVINAVPGFMGYRTLEAIIRAGKNVVDISFFNEDALELHTLAREKDVIAVVDCGVAPGLCNIIAGNVFEKLDRTERYECYVGGLPEKRERPFEYKAVFSPIDVLAEYTRPARLKVNGEIVIRPALSEVELWELPGVGTLEAFNTDGLRSLLYTMDVPDMTEKTLRYPGHADLMRVFRDSGFLSDTEIQVGDQQFRPIDITSRLLFDQWRLEPGEHDFTVMQVVLEGVRSDRRIRYTYDLLDRFDDETGVHSMARTTGYTATVVARLVLDGTYNQPGVSPPEYLGRQDGLLERVRSGLADRRIALHETIQEVEAVGTTTPDP